MESVIDNASQNEGKKDNKNQLEILNNNNEIISPEKLISQFKININKKEQLIYSILIYTKKLKRLMKYHL